MIRKKNGFTLVELLAVIVILAIILVIAVPQIMKTIDNARNGALSSSAKLIAASAEREYLARKTLGDTSFEGLEEIPCEDVVETNSNDYGKCTIKFDENGKATVSLQGLGKFEGKYVCGGNRNVANVTTQICVPVKLTFDLDGGSPNFEYDEEYESNSTVTLTEPIKEDYAFEYWEVVSGEGASVEGNTLVMGTTETKVKAHWKEKVALTVNPNEGVNTVEYEAKYKVGGEVQLTPPTREGYKFVKWEVVSGTGASVEGNTLVMGSDATEVRAEWHEVVTLTVKAPIGVTVIAESGELRYTAVSNEEGVATFESLEIGTWELTMTNGSETSNVVTIEITEDYETELSFFEAYITVTYPNGTCTVANGEETYTHSGGGTTTFTVKKQGTWTVTATPTDGVSEGGSQSVSITESNQTKSVSIKYRKYLVKNGRATSIAGGLVSGSSAQNSDNFYFDASPAGSMYWMSCKTSNSVSRGNYTKLVFDGYQKGGAPYLKYGSLQTVFSNTSRGTTVLDISSLSSGVVEITDVVQTTAIQVWMYNLWME